MLVADKERNSKRSATALNLFKVGYFSEGMDLVCSFGIASDLQQAIEERWRYFLQAGSGIGREHTQVKPEALAHQGDRIGEGGLALAIPGGLPDG